MEAKPIKQQIRAMLRTTIAASFLLVLTGTVACNDAFTPRDFKEERVIQGIPAAPIESKVRLVSVTRVESNQNATNQDEEATQTLTMYQAKFNLIDGTQELNLETWPDAGSDSVPGQADVDEESVLGLDYTIQAACADQDCTQVAVLYSILDTQAHEEYREALLFKQDGQVINQIKSTTFDSVWDALKVLSSDPK